MGALVNAAKYAKDTSAGGIRDQALAALVNQARITLSKTPPEPDQVIVAFAKGVIRDADRFADQAAWAVATDPAVSASLAPTEAMVNNAIITTWPFLATMTN